MPHGAACPREQQTATQQQVADAMPGGHQIAAQVLAATHEITQRFKLERRDGDRPQLSGRV
jgi:hypothetical protein